MPDTLKQVDYSRPVDYQWSKPQPLLFITHWGEKGDALWISPTYNSQALEKYRCRWGLSNNEARNTNNWMFRINFKQYSNKLFAVTDSNGVHKIKEIEDEIASIEDKLCELHTQLHHAKIKKLQIYRTVCKDFSIPVTSSDLKHLRDFAHEQGPGVVAKFKVS